MDNINLSNFLNNFIKFDQGQNPPRAKDTGAFNAMAQNADIKADFQVLKPAINQILQMQQLVQQNTALVTLLNNTDMSTMLKELLNMPQNFKDFLLLMSNIADKNNLSQQQLSQLLMTSNIDFSKMAVFLQQSGKDAMAKLIQIIANFNQMGGGLKTTQLNELVAVINASVSTTGNSQAQCLKNILLLYLPWLPLGEDNNFSLEIGNSGGENGGESDDAVTILISTVNFGNVKAVVFKQGQNTINIQISCAKEFPKDEVEKELKEESKNHNIHTGIAFEQKENKYLEKKENVQTQVSLNTGPGVNPFLILMAQAVMKIIIGIDKRYSLEVNRKNLAGS